MLEAAVPTIVFTVVWLTTRDLHLALSVSVGAALVLLVVRLVQRSTVQFVVNALFGIGIGWLFVHRSAASGGSEDDQALAYFLPGILYNTGYSVVLAFTCLIGWPLVGFMVGSVTGDPTAWHADKQVVRLCTRLTWLLVAPCLLRVAVQGADLARRHVRRDRRRHRRRRARRAQDRARLAAAARRARARWCGCWRATRPRWSRTQRPPDRSAGSAAVLGWGRAAARARPRRRPATTNSSSSPDSSGCSASGV